MKPWLVKEIDLCAACVVKVSGSMLKWECQPWRYPRAMVVQTFTPETALHAAIHMQLHFRPQELFQVSTWHVLHDQGHRVFIHGRTIELC